MSGLLEFIGDIIHNRNLYKTGKADKSVNIHTVIKASTSAEQIERSVKGGAIYTPPSKSASGLHEFSRKIKK